MTSLGDIAASYAAEISYQHDLDNVIDSSDVVLAIGNTKESTTELTDLSGTGNTGTIHGAMPSSGFFLGRRFNAANDNHLNCGNDSSLTLTAIASMSFVYQVEGFNDWGGLVEKGGQELEIRIENGSGGKYLVYCGGSFVANYTQGASILNKYNIITFLRDDNNNPKNRLYLNGILVNSSNTLDEFIGSTGTLKIGSAAGRKYVGIINYSLISDIYIDPVIFFNKLSVLQSWSINYTDYPDNATQYTDRLPYSTTIISSGTFKVDADKLQCTAAGTITYRAAHEFDGSEFIVVNKGLATEFSGTGSATSGNTTVSIAQGSNKITVAMGTADTIDSIYIQFRAEV